MENKSEKNKLIKISSKNKPIISFTKHPLNRNVSNIKLQNTKQRRKIQKKLPEEYTRRREIRGENGYHEKW